MNISWVRQFCLSLPHTTEEIQWGNHVLFKIGGKMYAIGTLEPPGNFLSFKCSPEDFGELTARPGLIPAPYLARAGWVAMETEQALTRAETQQQLRRSYDLIASRLPAKLQTSLGIGRVAAGPSPAPEGPRKTRRKAARPQK
jgi:predicted DNA-binding protein (MmcQ/YjbR family)